MGYQLPRKITAQTNQLNGILPWFVFITLYNMLSWMNRTRDKFGRLIKTNLSIARTINLITYTWGFNTPPPAKYLDLLLISKQWMENGHVIIAFNHKISKLIKIYVFFVLCISRSRWAIRVKIEIQYSFFKYSCEVIFFIFFSKS